MNQTTDDKITIIEGPPPVFEEIQDGWALGLNEGPYLHDLALTRLRAFNGQALVERCHRAWRNQSSINLEYRNELGLEETAPILAARSVLTDDGQVLLLWVRREPDLSDDDDIDDEDDENDELDDNDFIDPSF
jgi:hypothetical protein